MSFASRSAYERILRDLSKREQAVLGVLLNADQGMTNREIGRALALDRDSISPRTARLRQKGMVEEVGIRGSETVYGLLETPVLLKTSNRRPQAYVKAITDVRMILSNMIEQYGDEKYRSVLKTAIDQVAVLVR